MVSSFRPWLDAWADSAYGADGFWHVSRPAEHFRTASSTPQLPAALVDLLAEHPEIESVVELGAGDGQLLAGLSALRPELSLAGVDLRGRPEAGRAGRAIRCVPCWRAVRAGPGGARVQPSCGAGALRGRRKPGPITRAIQDRYMGIATGRIGDPYGWLTPVPVAEPVG